MPYPLSTDAKTLHPSSKLLHELQSRPVFYKVNGRRWGRNGAGPIEENLETSDGFYLYSTPRWFFPFLF